MSHHLFGLALGLVLLPLSATQAQEPVHQYARPGYATKTVYIWGAVGAPGVWRVEENVELIELLTAARLVGYGANSRGGRQDFILRIYRVENGSRTEIYSERVNRIISGAQEHPQIREGDRLAIETRQRIGWQSAASMIGAVSSFTLLVIRLLALRR